MSLGMRGMDPLEASSEGAVLAASLPEDSTTVAAHLGSDKRIESRKQGEVLENEDES